MFHSFRTSFSISCDSYTFLHHRTPFCATVTQFCDIFVTHFHPVRQLHSFASSDSILCNSYTLFGPVKQPKSILCNSYTVFAPRFYVFYECPSVFFPHIDGAPPPVHPVRQLHSFAPIRRSCATVTQFRTKRHQKVPVRTR